MLLQNIVKNIMMNFKSFIKWVSSFFVSKRLSEEKLTISAPKEEVIQKVKKQIEIQEKIAIPKVPIIKTTQKQVPPISESPNRIVENISGITFTFDKETYKKFKEEFSNNEEEDWKIDYDNKGCYLWRIKNNGYYEYFHRWLMQDEIDKFAKKYHLKTSDVIVHHKNHIHTDNRMSNLGLISRKEHNEHHFKEKAYQNWTGSRESFEKWWWEHHKE